MEATKASPDGGYEGVTVFYSACVHTGTRGGGEGGENSCLLRQDHEVEVADCYATGTVSGFSSEAKTGGGRKAEKRVDRGSGSGNCECFVSPKDFLQHQVYNLALHKQHFATPK